MKYTEQDVNNHIYHNYLKNNESPAKLFKEIVSRFVCENGFNVSIQASKYHYCEPRENGLSSYTKLELGYPSKMVPEYVWEYADNLEQLEDTVFAYVPIELVVKLLNDLGTND